MYQTVLAQDHPLARTDGRVLEHRMVLYDYLGPGPHPCHWCQSLVEWGDANAPLVVDHLDDDGANNDIDNLVPSCMSCNSRRSVWKMHKTMSERRSRMKGYVMTINYDIPNDLHQALKVRAAQEGITLKALIIQLLTEALEQ